MAEEKQQDTVEINMNETESPISDVGGKELFEDNLKYLKSNNEKTSRLKQPLDAAPTYTPVNFYEQFAHYDDKLYVNINNAWVNTITSGPQMTGGNSARTVGQGDGTQAITTGFEPKLIKITALWDDTDGSISMGNGTSDSNFQCVKFQSFTAGWEPNIETSYIVYVSNLDSSKSWSATISAISSTSFTLTWTGAGTPDNDCNFIWEAWG